MKNLKEILIKRCIKIIIMLLPSILWGTLVMYDICFGVSHFMFTIITNIIIAILCFSMLFMNTILTIRFTNDFEHMECEFKKVNFSSLCYGFITGLPLVLLLFFTPVWIFLLYGLLQCFYILADKDHMSVMERLYTQVEKIIGQIKSKHHHKKEREYKEQEDAVEQVKQANQQV